MSNASRSIALMLLAIAACGVAGCGGRAARAAIVADRRAAQYTRTLITVAARDSGCTAAQLSIQQIHPEVYSVVGCVVPREYWLACSSPGHCAWQRLPTVNEVAASTMQCPPQMIQQAPTADQMVRLANGCGQSSLYAIQCAAVGMGCGWVARGAAPTGPIIVEQGTIPVEQQAGVQPVFVPPPPQGVPASLNVQIQPGPAVASLQAQVMAQREALLSCIDGGSVSLSLRWTADGQVIAQVPPNLAGTAAEGCVQALLGSLRVQTAAPGQTVVALQ